MDQTDNAVLLKTVQDLLNKMDESAIHKEVSEQTKAIDAMRNCLSGIKKDLAVVMTEQKNHTETLKEKSEKWERVLADHELRLRDVPKGRCKTNEESIGELKKEMGTSNSFRNKVLGACLVISVIVPTSLTLVLTFVLKRYIGN